MKKAEFIIVGLCWLLTASHQPAWAMDRWAALSMLESGNNDAAIGRAGEVSRFQIKPGLWEKFGDPFPLDYRLNPLAALQVAQAIMRERKMNFEHRFHRPPTDFEYYVLWNAPSQIRKPSRVVAERAHRFCRLVAS